MSGAAVQIVGAGLGGGHAELGAATRRSAGGSPSASASASARHRAAGRTPASRSTRRRAQAVGVAVGGWPHLRAAAVRRSARVSCQRVAPRAELHRERRTAVGRAGSGRLIVTSAMTLPGWSEPTPGRWPSNVSGAKPLSCSAFGEVVQRRRRRRRVAYCTRPTLSGRESAGSASRPSTSVSAVGRRQRRAASAATARRSVARRGCGGRARRGGRVVGYTRTARAPPRS